MNMFGLLGNPDLNERHWKEIFIILKRDLTD